MLELRVGWNFDSLDCTSTIFARKGIQSQYQNCYDNMHGHFGMHRVCLYCLHAEFKTKEISQEPAGNARVL